MARTLMVVVPLVIAYAGALEWIWDSWWLPGSYYTHGPLVPLVAAVVIWLRRASWRAVEVRSDPRGWLLLGPALLLHVAGAALTIDSLSAVSLVLAVPGAALLVVGPGRLRGLWPALLITAFAIPLPMFVTGRVVFELKEIAVDSALALGNGLGLGAERTGARIMVPGQTAYLDVADPCSGLRSLVALTTLGYCVAFFMGSRRGWRPWVLLAAAAPIAIATNVLRIAAICFVARGAGVAYATSIGHDVLNGVAWIFDLGVLLLLDFLLSRRLRRAPS